MFECWKQDHQHRLCMLECVWN